jgi:flagellar biosynthesis protein FlhB
VITALVEVKFVFSKLELVSFVDDIFVMMAFVEVILVLSKCAIVAVVMFALFRLREPELRFVATKFVTVPVPE